jgi:hypothetical protein
MQNVCKTDILVGSISSLISTPVKNLKIRAHTDETHLRLCPFLLNVPDIFLMCRITHHIYSLAFCHGGLRLAPWTNGPDYSTRESML